MTIAEAVAELDKAMAAIEDLKAQVRLGVAVADDLMRMVDKITEINQELVLDNRRLRDRLAICETERDTWRAIR